MISIMPSLVQNLLLLCNIAQHKSRVMSLYGPVSKAQSGISEILKCYSPVGKVRSKVQKQEDYIPNIMALRAAFRASRDLYRNLYIENYFLS